MRVNDVVSFLRCRHETSGYRNAAYGYAAGDSSKIAMRLFATGAVSLQ